MLSQGEGLKRLFFDIETTPHKAYTWNLYNAMISYDMVIEPSKVICISYKWEGSEQVFRLNWDKNMDDKQMLTEFVEILNSADELVGHNGDRFDIRVVRTRCLFHRIPVIPTYQTLDTLKKARSGFKFPNNKLDTILKYLGIGEKLPHSGWSMWKKVMENSPDALTEMGNYCDIDVLRLEDLFLVMQNYFKHNTHTAVVGGGYKYECPNCGGEDSQLVQNRFTSVGTIKRLMECLTCSYHYEISNSSYRMMLELKSVINKGF